MYVTVIDLTSYFPVDSVGVARLVNTLLGVQLRKVYISQTSVVDF